MRELTKREMTLVSGGMNSISDFSLNHRVEPNHSSTFTATAGPFAFQKNTGTMLSWTALATGAAPIGGTVAALGVAAAGRNPGAVRAAYSIGALATFHGTRALCGHFENQQFKN